MRCRVVKDGGQSANASIPAGLIAVWSGAQDAIPAGWALCDGTNGTPDLRDRFIVGAGSAYGVGDTGGSNTVTLTAAQMPEHSHDIISYRPSGSGGSYISGTSSSTSGSAIATQSAGGGQAHENRPPYYALCFIMKL